MPRRLLVALVAVLVVAGCVVLAWQVAWPRFRPGLEPGERFGVDVSSHQGRIDWKAVAADRVDAAYVKASEGATWVDPLFVENWRGARSAGLSVGAYHFFTLCREGEEQARNLLARLDAVGGVRDPEALPAAVDLELGGNCAERPPREVVERRLVEFVRLVESATGREVVLYVLDNWESRYPVPQELGRGRWVRRLGLRPSGDWVWWQVHNRALVDGIDVPVDLDVVRGPLP